jgi:hypothetical protein
MKYLGWRRIEGIGFSVTVKNTMHMYIRIRRMSYISKGIGVKRLNEDY